MSLGAQAEADLAVTLEAPGDFGIAVTLTDPAELSNGSPVYGRPGDIGQYIDPDTGQAVTGRHATLTARLSSLAIHFTTIPVSIADTGGKPWLVAFALPGAALRSYKVKQAFPDRTLGVVTMVLEFWQAAP